MTCGHCVAKVKNELLKLGDVIEAQVALSAPQAVITMNKHISTAQLHQALDKAGPYTIRESEDIITSTGEAAIPDAKPSYFPIFLIFGYIAGISTLIQLLKSAFSWMQWMSHFMAGFFFVFSFFKFMNLRGFAEGYRSYDVVAKKIPAWGLIYPFVELALGIAFLSGFNPEVTSIVTFIVMGISAVGVLQSLLKKQVIQCACLGTVIRLPLSKVTLVEDALMVLMSAAMFGNMF